MCSTYICLSLNTVCHLFSFFFFFNDTATTEIYTLSLHDALPILLAAIKTKRHHLSVISSNSLAVSIRGAENTGIKMIRDRKSTRLNSSHSQISYAVFCLKKKKNIS